MDAEEFRRTGHQMIDRLADYLEGIEGEALFPNREPRELDALFDAPLPQDPTPPEALLAELDEKLIPNCCHVGHPGYFGFITPSPTPIGALGDLMASVLNQNIGSWSIGPGAVALERRALRWLADLAGYDRNSGGHFTSGGTMANFEGVKLARDAISGDRAQHDGVEGRWAVYVSEERHVSIDKAVDAVGLGRRALRPIPTDDAFRVRLDALEAALATDRAAGIRPLCIIGLAGTTNTGALDPLDELRRIADREGCWLHVDAAYGGGMLLSRKWPDLLRHLRLADSITIDPHKWFYAPVDAGALLVRDASRLRHSYGMEPAYLRDDTDADNVRFQYYVNSFEQSRRFRGLKVWLSLRRYGAREIGEWVDTNVDQALLLHRLVAEHPRFVPAAAPEMSGLCFRYREDSLDLEALHRLHIEVVRRVETAGRYWITTTMLKGRIWFRVNIVNFRTREEHVRGLLEELERSCGEEARGSL